MTSDPQQDDMRHCAPRDAAYFHWLRAFFGWCFKVTVTARGAVADPATYRMVTDAVHPVVVMVPGFQGPISNFHFLHGYLATALSGTCDLAVADTLDPGMGLSPDDNAERLDQFLVEHGIKGRPLYLIGHSMGGLIARRYQYWPGAASDIRGIVMIATPNGGVNWWNVLPIQWVRSNGFAARFNALFPLRPDTPYLNLTGTRGLNLVEGYPNDGVVGAWSTRHGTGGVDIIERAYAHDHMSLLNDPQVAEEIVAFVRGIEAG